MATKGKTINTSILPTIRLNKLQAGDKNESSILLDACRVQGFFYLDLTSDPTICQQWEDILTFSKQYFTQPLQIKMQDACGSKNTGYEPVGGEAGPELDTRNGYEGIKISRREFLKGETDLSTAARNQKDLFFGFMQGAHTILMLMLNRLSDEMGLKGSARFETHHAEPGESLSNLTLLRYPKKDDSMAENSVGHNKHTDLGSLTFLLTKQWGLQVLSNETKTWGFVEPRSGHAIINVGDSLRFPSGGELASVVHRVIPLHAKQHEDRYSFAYFLRVNDNLRFSDGSGKSWSAKEWHDFKFNTFNSPDAVENGMQILTGMMEDSKAVALKVG